MKNEIHYISAFELRNLSPFSGFVANFDGQQIQNKEELFYFLEKIVGLPDVNNWSSITDWLTDLSWLEAKEYTFIFENYNSFLKDDLSAKELFLEILEEDVLPWWENDVEKNVVSGMIKSFQVYIVED
ncbi:barstar family protein [Streptococcus mitis]|uniref:barstar family protein n=1 Tax=Streptococcus mitis TaxID=28037 RepID=UPI0021B51307|nr:barstar family protein [Streptococcus mitis]